MIERNGLTDGDVYVPARGMKRLLVVGLGGARCDDAKDGLGRLVAGDRGC